MTRVLGALCALSALVFTLAPESGSTASLAAPHFAGKQFGVAYADTLPFLSPTALAAALEDAVTLGATWIRLDLSWADVAPDGPGQYQWANFDRVVAAADARGLEILPTIVYTPAWARPAGCNSDKCAPASDAAFAAFAKAAAERYAPRGIEAWEIWNEENSPTFWAPRPSATGYTNLLRATAAAIRSVDPSAFIISGGLTATLTVKGAVDTRKYLTEICALGANKIVNAIGYHPYTYPYLPSQDGPFATAWNKIDQTEPSMVSILAKYKTPNLPIWLTEYGAPSGGPGEASNGSPATITPRTDHVTSALQAEMASDAVKTVYASKQIDAMFWYTDRDLPATGSPEDFYGLRRVNGTAKPVFAALGWSLHHDRPGRSGVG